MPYSASNVSGLPSNVQKMGDKDRRQWVEIFNSAHSRCMDKGGDTKACDSSAFAQANGVLARGKALELLELDEGLDLDLDSLIDEAKATAASINDLPDSAFAYVESGGSKDAEGKTTPRSLRHFPIHDEAHVRNALARLEGDQSPVAEKARAKVEAAARRMGIGRPAAEARGKAAVVALLGGAQPMVAVGKRWGLDGIVDLVKRPKRSPIVFAKQADGRVRYFAQTSNNFKDRHGQIITEAAHREYVAWVQRTKMYPELLVYHAVGTRLGEDDWMDMCGGVRCDSGLVDVEKEYLVDSLLDTGVDLGVSHRFLSAESKNGYIEQYRGWELSVLPRTDAANIWGGIDFAREEQMGFNPAQKQFLVQLYGDAAVVDSFEKATDELNKSLKDLGIESKSAEGEGGDATAAAGDGEGTVAAAAQPTADPTVLASIAELTTAVQGLAQVVQAQQKDIAGLKATDDEKVASVLGAAIAGGKGFVASQSKDNVTEKEEPKPEDDWFGKVVVGPAAQHLGIR